MKYKIWFDENEMGYNLDNSMKEGIDNSTVVLVCLDKKYEDSKNCMFELSEAKKRSKTIVTLGINH